MFLVFISLIFAALLIFNKKIMIKKRLEKAAKFILLCFLGALVYSCSPDDGKDGLGFEEMTKYGSITTTLSGKLGDGKNFEKTDVFKFSSSNGKGSIVFKGETGIYFDLERTQDVGDGASIYLRFGIENIGTADEKKYLRNEFEGLNLMSSGSFVPFWGEFYNNPGSSNIDNLKIENYSYDNTTKKLKFSFSYTIAATESYIGNILTVRGVVDVVVLEGDNRG